MNIGDVIGMKNPGDIFMTRTGCDVSPAMLDAVYTLLLVLIVSLCVVGLITAGRWLDHRLETVVRWFQLREANKRFVQGLAADVIHLNDRSK